MGADETLPTPPLLPTLGWLDCCGPPLVSKSSVHSPSRSPLNSSSHHPPTLPCI